MADIVDLLLALAQNISLFVLMTVAFSALERQLHSRSRLVTQLIAGLLFGSAAVISIASPYHLAHGLLIDGRHVVIAVGTVVGGPLAGVLCTAMAALYRWEVGGDGTLPAVLSMMVTLIIAAALRHHWLSSGRSITVARLGVLGFTVAIASLGRFALLPTVEDPALLLQTAIIPILVLVPAGTCLAGTAALWVRQKEALQAELAITNRRLELALKSSEEGVFEYDFPSRRMWTSQRYRDIRGYGEMSEDTELAFWRSLILPEDLATLEQEFARLQSGAVDRIDVVTGVRHRDGRILQIRSQAASHTDADGKVVRIVGSSTDETARLAAEIRLRSAIDAMESGFALYGADDRLIACNDAYIDPATRAAFGNPVGRTFEEILSAFAQGEVTAVEAAADRDGWLRRRMEQHRNPPGRPLEVKWTDGRWFRASERRTPDGGAVGVWTDITDQKRRQAELKKSKRTLEAQAAKLKRLAEDIENARDEAVRAREDAERASGEKSRFLASMSHELRTPLNAIIGFSEIIKAELFGPIAPRYAEYGRLIHGSGEHLLSLINDLLDLSKIEAGRMTLAIEALPAESICRQAIELVRELAAERGVALSCAIEPGLTRLDGDDRAVRQILLNLLSNAIKFTEAGGSVRLGISGDRRGATILVTDTGIGMTTAEMAQALEPYGQVDSALARRSTGTGLGLPLTKSLAELHGGSLSMSSQPGVGTSVSVCLPWRRALPAPEQVRAEAAG